MKRYGVYAAFLLAFSLPSVAPALQPWSATATARPRFPPPPSEPSHPARDAAVEAAAAAERSVGSWEQPVATLRDATLVGEPEPLTLAPDRGAKNSIAAYTRFERLRGWLARWAAAERSSPERRAGLLHKLQTEILEQSAPSANRDADWLLERIDRRLRPAASGGARVLTPPAGIHQPRAGV